MDFSFTEGWRIEATVSEQLPRKSARVKRLSITVVFARTQSSSMTHKTASMWPIIPELFLQNILVGLSSSW